MKFTVEIPGADSVVVEAREGWTVMEAIRDAGLPITAQCGGGCSCATCHVHFDVDSFAKLPPISEEEQDLLESSDYYDPGHSRLSCQIICDDGLDGLIVQLQPDSI
ncbi:MAG: 2Fe-2S iron-sulfur cluster-binding protein [Novosphingobium sp.]